VWLDDAQRAVGVDQWGQRGRHGGLNLINGGNAHIDPIPTKGINHIIHSQTEVAVVIVGGCSRVSIISIIRTVAARAGIIIGEYKLAQRLITTQRANVAHQEAAGLGASKYAGQQCAEGLFVSVVDGHQNVRLASRHVALSRDVGVFLDGEQTIEPVRKEPSK
jgi:hypothetical protein